MITIRKADERGTANYGWLQPRYSFSFAEYHDAEHMGFRMLRVLNEDRIAPGGKFPMHDHRDMEILTYVIDGSIEHRDSMGNTSIVRAGEFQIMSAGTGVTHSEENPSAVDPLHLLQIWIFPSKRGLTPRYEQTRFDDCGSELRRVVSATASDGALKIHQDAEIYSAKLETGASVGHTFNADRHGWLQLVSGSLTVSGTELATGDGAQISSEDSISITANEDSEFLLFDLA